MLVEELAEGTLAVMLAQVLRERWSEEESAHSSAKALVEELVQRMLAVG